MQSRNAVNRWPHCVCMWSVVDRIMVMWHLNVLFFKSGETYPCLYTAVKNPEIFDVYQPVAKSAYTWA
jgi:hypothetical protein